MKRSHHRHQARRRLRRARKYDAAVRWIRQVEARLYDAFAVDEPWFKLEYKPNKRRQRMARAMTKVMMPGLTIPSRPWFTLNDGSTRANSCGTVSLTSEF